MIEEAIKTLLSENTQINAIVSGRVFSPHLPQNPTLPAIAFFKVSTTRNQTHDGDSGVSESRFQIDCSAQSSLQAKQLGNAVAQLFKCLKTEIGSEKIYQTEIANQFELSEPDLSEYREVLDVMFIYRDN